MEDNNATPPLGSLVIVGSGIKFISHLTTEARAYICNADRVLYLVNEPAMKEWILEHNKNAKSLDELYNQYTLRSKSYQAIADYIVETVRNKFHVCVVIYGHPTFLAQPTLKAIKQARKEGYDARALPGISAEDCLYADLLIDPGTCGSQSFEATDFLLRKRKFNASSHLILFQIGYLGVIEHDEPKIDDKKRTLILLLDYLLGFYEKNHQVYFYEAAQYPTFAPRIDQFSLETLPSVASTPLTTLYTHRHINKK